MADIAVASTKITWRSLVRVKYRPFLIFSSPNAEIFHGTGTVNSNRPWSAKRVALLGERGAPRRGTRISVAASPIGIVGTIESSEGNRIRCDSKGRSFHLTAT